MSGFQEYAAKNRRLTILRLLADAPSYEANNSVLQMALEEFGHSVSRDLIRTDVDWLAEQGLVAVRDIASVAVVTLLPRGADVAAGRATVKGVQRPGPKA